MHELNTNLAAVGMSISIEQISEHPLLLLLHDCAAKWHGDAKLTVHISLRESVAGRVQQAKQFFIGEVELFSKAGTVSVVLFQF